MMSPEQVSQQAPLCPPCPQRLRSPVEGVAWLGDGVGAGALGARGREGRGGGRRWCQGWRGGADVDDLGCGRGGRR